MKKIGIILFIFALTVGVMLANFFSFGNSIIKSPFSIAFGKVQGSGNVVTVKREVSGFKNVDVSGMFTVEIIAQKDFSLEVEADDNLIPLIKTEVNGDTLKIENDKSFSSHKSLVIRISAPNIEELDVSGVTKTSIKNLGNHRLSIESSGASKVYVEGRTDKLEIEMSGASKIETKELLTKKASIDGSGASRAYINVSEVLTAELSGASNVSYLGNPLEINKKTSGASRLKQGN